VLSGSNLIGNVYIHMSALIVCHAGTGLGLGHLSRSLVVARSITQELGIGVSLLIQGDSVQRGDLAEFDHQFLGIDEDLVESVLQQARQVDAQIVIFDLHPRLIPEDIESLLGLLRQSGRKTIGVDSLVNHRSNLDLVFIPSFCFSEPENFTGKSPILFGWDCYLLNVKRLSMEWEHGVQVLALTGGSDATDLGKTLPIKLNDALSSSTELHWVTGPYAQQPVKIESPRISMVNHQSPSGLDDLMINSNYAVTVFGVSFFELLYYGVPTVVFSPYGNKDDAELAAIATEGVALVAWNEVEAVAKLKELMADDELAASLSLCARQKLSVLGGHKFAQAVAGMVV
jgi:spore coat polysaccharide biosynthesis predicted glycosyltransferase SpsG